MILKEGQIINDGECATKEHEGFWYVYVLNDEKDELGFYKITIENDIYNFELVEDSKKVEELILLFAKDYAEKNPDATKELKEFMDLNSKEGE